MSKALKRISKLYLWQVVLTIKQMGDEWITFSNLKALGLEWGWIEDASSAGFVEIKHPEYEVYGNVMRRARDSEYQFRLRSAEEAVNAIHARIEKYKYLRYDQHPVYQSVYQHALDCLSAIAILYEGENIDYVAVARQHLQASNPFEDTPLFDKAGKALDMVQRTLFKELS